MISVIKVTQLVQFWLLSPWLIFEGVVYVAILPNPKLANTVLKCVSRISPSLSLSDTYESPLFPRFEMTTSLYFSVSAVLKMWVLQFVIQNADFEATPRCNGPATLKAYQKSCVQNLSGRTASCRNCDRTSRSSIFGPTFRVSLGLSLGPVLKRAGWIHNIAVLL